MSAATATAYQTRFAGRIVSAGSRRSPQNKAFYRCHSTFSGKAHCIKDRVLLDDTCGDGGFLAWTKREQRGDME